MDQKDAQAIRTLTDRGLYKAATDQAQGGPSDVLDALLDEVQGRTGSERPSEFSDESARDYLNRFEVTRLTTDPYVMSPAERASL